jgi:RNA polymerase sigma factor (sigma-70 family)
VRAGGAGRESSVSDGSTGYDRETVGRFERAVLPHLDAAYNLARWLAGEPADAEDVVQEAYLRALRGFGTFHGGDVRCWVLTIVRNTCYTWLRRNRGPQAMASLDDEAAGEVESTDPRPDAALLRHAEAAMVREAIEQLPPEFREAIVLRELEGLSYKQIAEVTHLPMGTVMSRLARARQRLQQALAERVSNEV